MEFQLFGFEIYRRESLYGVWFFGLGEYRRHLLCIYKMPGELLIEILFFRFSFYED